MSKLGVLLSACEIYCGAGIAPAHLEAAEELILNELDDCLLAPTAIEYASMLLFIGNSSIDFSNVTVPVTDYII
jgi:hypothetical protein